MLARSWWMGGFFYFLFTRLRLLCVWEYVGTWDVCRKSNGKIKSFKLRMSRGPKMETIIEWRINEYGKCGGILWQRENTNRWFRANPIAPKRKSQWQWRWPLRCRENQQVGNMKEIEQKYALNRFGMNSFPSFPYKICIQKRCNTTSICRLVHKAARVRIKWWYRLSSEQW